MRLHEMYKAMIDGLDFAQAIQVCADACVVIASSRRARSVFGDPDYYGDFGMERVAIHLLPDVTFYMRSLQWLMIPDHTVIISRTGWLKPVDPTTVDGPVLTVDGVSYLVPPAEIGHFLEHGEWP